MKRGVHDAVRRYLSLGWSPIPIDARSKKPTLKDWPNRRFNVSDVTDHFSSHGNVGVLTGDPSNGLIDIDLDCDEAVELAELFLPATAMRSGRTSRPCSHWWFRVTDTVPANAKFTDVDEDKTVLIEQRGNGQQTLMPPSVHPDDEPYVLDGPLEPAEITGAELEQAVRRLAAATLLTRHWPRQPGSRHEIANALAGMLLRASWSEQMAAEFIGAVASSAGDEESRQRARNAVASARTLDRGGKVTGAPTLVDLIGNPVVEKLRAWLGLRGLTAYTAYTAYPVTESNPWPESLVEQALYGVAGDFVRLVGPHTEADPAALLVQFLVGFGNLVGRGPFFLAEADRHYSNLFVGITGATSKGRKGTAWGQTRQRLASADEDWDRERQQGGLSSGEGLIWAVRDAIMGRSPIRQKGRIVGYEDVESDPGIGDKRLLVFEPELASTLRVLGRDGNTLSPMIRQAWDTGDLRVLTKNSPAVATRAHISIVGHITRDELRRYLDRTEAGNGFANRFLWICAKRARVLPEGGRLSSVDFAPFIRDLSDATRFARQLGSLEVRRDDEARDLWHAVYPQLSEGKPGLFGAVTSRAEAQVMRLALVYALLDQSARISRPHLEAALAVWTYAENSARYIFGDALGDPVADQILHALRAQPDGMTRNEIREMFKRNRRAAEIDRALALLVEHGLARVVTEDTGGRPAERWYAATGYAVYAINAVSQADQPRYGVNRVYRVPQDTAEAQGAHAEAPSSEDDGPSRDATRPDADIVP